MDYKPIPFSFIMPEVPAHISDGEIARLWGSYPYIRSIQMEPFVDNSKGCNRVTIHFDDFKGFGDELREKITNGYYKSNIYDFQSRSAVKLPLCSSYLLPCEISNPKRTEYSHIVALQLKDVVREQAIHIQKLEDQIANMEASIRCSNNIYMDNDQLLESKILEQENMIHRLDERCKHMEDLFNKTILQYDQKIKRLNDVHAIEQQNQYEYMESRLQEYNIKYENHYDCMESRLQEYNIKQHKKHYDWMESRFQEYIMKHEKQYKSDHKTIMALSEWCSQPMWKRSNSFVLSAQNDVEEYSSEF
jgi:hypothetical protein